jgi:hypothetical protein
VHVGACDCPPKRTAPLCKYLFPISTTKSTSSRRNHDHILCSFPKGLQSTVGVTEVLLVALACVAYMSSRSSRHSIARVPDLYPLRCFGYQNVVRWVHFDMGCLRFLHSGLRTRPQRLRLRKTLYLSRCVLLRQYSA